MQKSTDKLVDSLAEIAIISKGGITYKEMKEMPPREFLVVQKALTRYLKAKAKAYGAKDSIDIDGG